MNELLAILIYLISGFVAAISQIIMKKAAIKRKEGTGIRKYIKCILFAYFMLFATLLLNMIALRFMQYKFAPVFSSVSYVFVIILSKLILKEDITWNQRIGMILIFTGMGVFGIG
jgi:small multidrug resistance pump